jgi:hypothetical protein
VLKRINTPFCDDRPANGIAMESLYRVELPSKEGSPWRRPIELVVFLASESALKRRLT